jgi:hypothetical protein
MRLVIRSVSSIDCPNVRIWRPDDAAVVAEELTVRIGPKSEKIADTFFLRVATPAGLASLSPSDGILAAHPLLVMRRYDFDDLWRWLEQRVAECEADTWLSCVDKLGAYFRCEHA